MKKYLFLSLASVLFVSQVAFAAFTDVDVSEGNHDQALAITWLKENGVVEGYSDGTFRPNNNVNRAEFLKMLYETIGFMEADVEMDFPDVPTGEWYTPYVERAFADGVVNGYPDGTFRPENSINYAEAVKIVANGFFDVDDLHLSGIYRLCVADLSYMSESGAWYWKYFSVADRYCVIPEVLLTGMSGLDPAGLVSRGVMAELLYRAKAVKDNYDGEGYPRYDDGVSPDGILVDDAYIPLDDDDGGGDDGMMEDEPFSLTSSAFNNNGTIDAVYTCDGADVSPQLSITGVPSTAESLALILDDPDAPSGTWVHWVVWNIPADTTELEGGGISSGLPMEAVEGTNSFGDARYNGPCPPLEDPKHRYYFKLYALDTDLTLDSSNTKGDLEMAMEGHILDTVELMGKYGYN